MAAKNNTDIGFEKQIWDAACVLWGHIPAAEYRKVIVGLIFLRYISSAFEKRYEELIKEGDGFENDRDAYAEENIFFVPEEARWSTIASAAHTPEIGLVIDNAMRAIEKENTTLKNVLPKNYASPDLDKRVLGEVVDLFTNEVKMDGTEASKDLLGRTYEYCIAQFASYEGTKGGEFYTPSSIVKTIVSILKPFNNCRVYDPCCGSGGMFVQSEKFVQAHSDKRGTISVYGQESNADTWKMAKMNMAIRGIDANFGPYHADTFFNDLHKTLKADFIMANPPFNLSNWGQDKLKEDVRWKYGLPPAGNANYAWILHMLSHLKPNKGVAGFLLANGALNDSDTLNIRRKLIENDKVEAIIVLPRELFITTDISVTLWMLNQNKRGGEYNGRNLRDRQGEILFVDLRQWTENRVKDENKKKVQLTHEQIQRAVDIYHTWQNVGTDGNNYEAPELYRSVHIKEIEENNWALTPSKYIEFIDRDLDIDFKKEMSRIQKEMSNLMKQEKASQKMLEEAFRGIGYEID